MAPASLDNTTLNLLLTEILGVSPQILLDDYTNVSHDNVRQTTEGLEAGLRAWIESSPSLFPEQKKALAELESGIIKLQTLIDSQSDFAFDLFEVWVWRNIFDVPAGSVPFLVMPHHKGLDLTIGEREESEAREELGLMRRRLEAMTRIDELLKDGVKASRRRKQRAESMLHELEFLESTNELRDLPPTITSLFTALRQVPTSSSLLVQPPPTSSAPAPSSKPAWSRSHDSFLAWSTARAIDETRKTGEIGLRGRMTRNAAAAEEFMRGMDDATKTNGNPGGGGIAGHTNGAIDTEVRDEDMDTS